MSIPIIIILFAKNGHACEEEEEIDEDHVRIPHLLAEFLKTKLASFFEEGFLRRLQMTANNNRIEALNKSFASLLPKDVYHPREESYNAMAYVVAIMANHGKELGFSEIFKEIGLSNFITPELVKLR